MDSTATTRRATRKPTHRLSTGISGLDDILCGGLTAERVYLVEGSPGSGKTTLGLQFLLDGRARGERGLYITLSETADELDAVAESHGWTLDGIDVFELADETVLDPDAQQSILHPAEVELGETTRGVLERVDRVQPARVVFDSLSEFRLLAQNPLRYRRQILALKQFFTARACTVLLLDDKSSQSDQHLHSISHGVISLEQIAQEFGKERRRVNIIKMRGIAYRGGYHDYVLETGGIRMFPRLVAAEHASTFEPAAHTTGSGELDALLGGGLIAGTNTLIVGPSGVGKSTVTVRCMLAALERGEKAAFYLFDEGLGTFMARNMALGMDLRPYLASGHVNVRHIDSAELSPGEFAQMLRDAVETGGVTFLAIDSLNAYLQAMPGEQYLTLQMHELLGYLNQKGVTTMLVLGEHGLVGQMQRDVDLSYLSDTTVLLRFFEAAGKLRRAITVVKNRTTNHALTIHELQLHGRGIGIGAPLAGFEGVLTGLPSYRGGTQMMATNPDAPA
ncbi:ATPase domain-containing protein [Pseudoduganella albidiflava]|uniref:non-specific serine/threonine protein kinase n=1 Tax=Pseudoduganella albidiflava TaxID=321983 RepID=A0A411WWZ7_9BURK|nr:ATPase domain-containing protein [Pseudoduganella albidiflava]QBI01265.1 circadian clock protein KaiC [Pseudoduganella albidiflava]GGY37055.1 circadian clock protein KaiC [Pseudoduganella albidiflava]